MVCSPVVLAVVTTRVVIGTVIGVFDKFSVAVLQELPEMDLQSRPLCDISLEVHWMDNLF